jgi:tetratricopeptide (TPR) repeat protein
MRLRSSRVAEKHCRRKLVPRCRCAVGLIYCAAADMTPITRPAAAGRILLIYLAVACVVIAAGPVGCATRRQRAGDAYFRGVAEHQKGKDDQAMRDLSRATQLNPDLTAAHSILGDLYQSKGNLEGAAKEFAETVRLDPSNFDNNYRLGFANQLMHRMQDAASAYLRALELRPNDPRTNYNLGSVYLALSQFDDAVKYLRRATELDPKFGDAWANLGVALDLQGNAPAAELAYKRSIELRGAIPEIVLNLGLNLLAQGKAGEAADVLGNAAKQMNTPFARQRFADALAQSHKYDEAANEYEAALNIDPNYFPALNGLGYALIQKYQQGLELDDEVRKAATDNWKQSLAINPSQPRIRQQLRKWDQHMFGGGNGPATKPTEASGGR